MSAQQRERLGASHRAFERQRREIGLADQRIFEQLMVLPTRHFDPLPPKGDPIEIWVAWNPLAGPKRVRIEELLFDKRTNRTVPEGPWVYTGSTIVGPGQYLADMDGVLIGFVHSPAPVIENPRIGAVDAYGDIIRNPSLDMPGGMNVTVTIRALTAADHPRPAALPNNQPLIPEEDR